MGEMKTSVDSPAFRIVAVVVLFLFVQMMVLPEALALGSGGFSNQVVGLRALGKGNSATASPEDATTVYMNPAGMAFLDESELETGVTFEVLQFGHKTFGGNPTENEKSVISVPHLFFTTGNDLDERLSFGFGMAAPYGLITEWDDASFARFQATNTELTLIEFNPVVAYRVSDDFSVAGGFSFWDSTARLEKKVNVSRTNSDLTGGVETTPNLVGHQEITADGHGVSYNFGLYYEPNENHRFGTTFRSKASIQNKGRLRLSGLSGTFATAFGGSTYETRTESKLTLPESIEMGYAYTPDSKKWTWEADFAWTGWDAVEATIYEWPQETGATRLLVLNPANVNPFPRDWKSTISVGTGFEYKALDWLKLRTGYYFYETPVPGDHFEASLPDTDRHNFTGGLGVEWKDVTVDAAYVLIVGDARRINNSVADPFDSTSCCSDNGASNLDGIYDSLSHLFGVNVSWRF